MQIPLSIAVYVSLGFVFGYVMASLAPKAGVDEHRGDDEF